MAVAAIGATWLIWDYLKNNVEAHRPVGKAKGAAGRVSQMSHFARFSKRLP